jgi:hypothetical protein
VTFIGQTGCGFVMTYFTFILNTSGSGSGPVVQHTSGYGSMGGTFTFNISTLIANGSGTGGIGCGTDCGWNLISRLPPGLFSESLMVNL